METHIQYGVVSVATTGETGPALTGAIAAMFTSLVLSIGVSLIWPKHVLLTIHISSLPRIFSGICSKDMPICYGVIRALDLSLDPSYTGFLGKWGAGIRGEFSPWLSSTVEAGQGALQCLEYGHRKSIIKQQCVTQLS